MNFFFHFFSLSCLDRYVIVINYHVYSPESGLSENEDKMNPKVKLKQKSYSNSFVFVRVTLVCVSVTLGRR